MVQDDWMKKYKQAQQEGALKKKTGGFNRTMHPQPYIHAP